MDVRRLVGRADADEGTSPDPLHDPAARFRDAPTLLPLPPPFPPHSLPRPSIINNMFLFLRFFVLFFDAVYVGKLKIRESAG